MFAFLAHLASRRPWWIIGSLDRRHGPAGALRTQGGLDDGPGGLPAGQVRVDQGVLNLSTRPSRSSRTPARRSCSTAPTAIPSPRPTWPRSRRSSTAWTCRRSSRRPRTPRSRRRSRSRSSTSRSTRTPPGQDPDEYNQVKDLRDDLSSATKGTDLRAQTTGNLPQTYDQAESGSNAEAIVGLATVVLILVLLGIIFRSVIIALMPILAVGLILSPVSSALINIAAKLFDLQKDDSTTVILIVVLFGIGTDYILFFLFRYRERMRAGDEHKVAVAQRPEAGRRGDRLGGCRGLRRVHDAGPVVARHLPVHRPVAGDRRRRSPWWPP